MSNLLSPAKKSKQERDAKICAAFRNLHNKYSLRLQLYIAIGELVGVSHVTVVRVLQKNKLI